MGDPFPETKIALNKVLKKNKVSYRQRGLLRLPDGDDGIIVVSDERYKKIMKMAKERRVMRLLDGEPRLRFEMYRS